MFCCFYLSSNDIIVFQKDPKKIESRCSVGGAYDVFKGPIHENPQWVLSVVRVDVSSPYLQGVWCSHMQGNQGHWTTLFSNIAAYKIFM